jgi:hypothetical protein
MKRISIIAAGALAVATVIGAWQSPATPARAATGDTLRQFTAAVPACGSGIGTGIAFDGTRIYLSCWGSNVLERVNPADGSSLGSMTIAGLTDIGAMAYDASRGKIWVCQGGSQVYLVDPVAFTSASQFAVAGCVDGFAYDGSDDTIWASPDAYTTIYHYTNAGALIASFPIGSLLGGSGNSGIAVGGTNLYLGNDGGSQIYQCDKALVACTLMSTSGRRVEDLECDNVTFAPNGAIWSQDAFDRILTAYEIPAGSCAFGGVEATPTPTATPTEASQTPVRLKTHTPTPTQTAAPTSTPTPVTPTNTAAPSATAVSTSPTGGRAGVITGPNTGGGPAGGSSRSTLLFGAAMVAVAGAFATAMGRKVRR